MDEGSYFGKNFTYHRKKSWDDMNNLVILHSFFRNADNKSITWRKKLKKTYLSNEKMEAFAGSTVSSTPVYSVDGKS
jgi:hypothetical protein